MSVCVSVSSDHVRDVFKAQETTSTRANTSGWWHHHTWHGVWKTPLGVSMRMRVEKENSKNSSDLMDPWKGLRHAGVPDPTVRGIRALPYHWAAATCYLQTRASVHLESVSQAPSSAFITLGPGSGITHPINLPLFISKRVSLKKTATCCHPGAQRSSALPGSLGVHPLPADALSWSLPLSPRSPPFKPCTSSPARSAPQSQAFPLCSFIRHIAEGTSISTRAFLPRHRTCFKWSKEI